VRPESRAALERACRRLDVLDFYRHPVRMRRVRLIVAPWFFRLPPFRRFDGYATHWAILLREPPGPGGASDDLVTHELCHVWQMQHHPIRMPLSYLLRGYRSNPFEKEARWAARTTCNTSRPPGASASDR
jgi:hypothetical protein